MLTGDEKVRLPEPSYTILDSYNISDAPPRPNAYIRYVIFFNKFFFNLRLDLTLMCTWLTVVMTNISDCSQVVTAAEVP